MNHSKIAGSIIALISLLAAFVFLYIGFTSHVWHPTWMVFLVIPIASMVTDIVCKKKNIAGIVTGIVSTICAITYLCMGLLGGLWHPGWLIFFAVPITSIIADMFTKKSAGTNDQNSDSGRTCD